MDEQEKNEFFRRCPAEVLETTISTCMRSAPAMYRFISGKDVENVSSITRPVHSWQKSPSKRMTR